MTITEAKARLRKALEAQSVSDPSDSAAIIVNVRALQLVLDDFDRLIG